MKENLARIVDSIAETLGGSFVVQSVSEDGRNVYVNVNVKDEEEQNEPKSPVDRAIDLICEEFALINGGVDLREDAQAEMALAYTMSQLRHHLRENLDGRIMTPAVLQEDGDYLKMVRTVTRKDWEDMTGERLA